jgi:hypothetical protein
MGFSQTHRNRSTLDDVPDLVRVLVLKGFIAEAVSITHVLEPTYEQQPESQRDT